MIGSIILLTCIRSIKSWQTRLMSTEQEMPMYERDTLVIENHDHIDVDQIQMHNIDTYTHSNISHQ